MIEIACGLEYLHKNNIIHGDLKPENVLVKKTEHNRDTLQIGDLDDLVEMQRSVTCSVDVTHLRGTTQYMSPEMVKKFAGVSNEIPGRKTDIWSLGCIMLELANCAMNLQDVWIQKDGQAVEVSNTRMPTTRFLTMVIDGGVPFLDISLPLDLASCIQYCLCTNVEERISADELVLYLSAARYHGRRLDQTSSVDITSGKHVIFFHMIADPGRCCWHRCSNVPLVHRNLVFVQLFNVSANTISKGLLPDDIHGEFLYPFIAIGKQGTICQTIDVHQDDSSVNTFVWNIASQTSRPLYISDSSLLFYRPIMVGNMIYFWDQRATFAEFKKANTLDGSVESIAGPEITVRVNRILCGAIVDHQLIYIALVSGGFNKDSTRMYCYDTITGEWRCIQGLVNDRVGFELVALHGKLYLLGGIVAGIGQIGHRALKTCYRLDLESLRRTKISPLLQARGCHCAFVMNDEIYVFGGRGRKGTLLKTMERYDVQNDCWSEVNLHASESSPWSKMIASDIFAFAPRYLRTRSAVL
ncbi:uncharacterized protein LOC129595884 [Paramacrobiotus metropolitanus]|uniref:uncharacterized protein LOC129595884 n=1 Tax=Paramacrobiotus metropolitanus TaxID=2943436 RepID=UPI002446142D|nr:uncharacterized protein LOC129595884 [Paramacrobiotus metropolitanus]XP_055348992.1 uncharacterized protein LOC129595884 [Paramacrobiotus metropolitanus]